MMELCLFMNKTFVIQNFLFLFLLILVQIRLFMSFLYNQIQTLNISFFCLLFLKTGRKLGWIKYPDPAKHMDPIYHLTVQYYIIASALD